MTTRHGGVSEAPWGSLNLGDHVGDKPENVKTNRALVAHEMQVPAIYLRQVHGVHGVAINSKTPANTEADVAWTRQEGLACTMMVADCLPILICHSTQKWVAAAHAGWRGLAGENGHGVVEALASTVRLEGFAPEDCLVWLGPCIGPTAFEVGPEVLAAFEKDQPAASSKAFFAPGPAPTSASEGKYMADLAWLARHLLRQYGLTDVQGNDSSAPWCTFLQQTSFFSHRRDGVSGRFAAGIALV